jgi:hypothetical protein
MLGAIRDALELGPLSSDRLAADLGITQAHALWALRKLKAHKLARIGGWEVLEQGMHQPLYSFGPGVNVRRIEPIGRTPARTAVYQQRYRAKVEHFRMLQATAGAIEPTRLAA